MNQQSTFQEVIEALERERDYQDSKWGTIEENSHPMTRWAEIFSEFASKIYDEAIGDDERFHFMLEAVAIGIAAMEQHGAVERNYEQYCTELNKEPEDEI